MTHETMRKVEQSAFHDMRRDAIKCMTATIGTQVDDSWEGIMRALDEVKRKGSPDEFAAVYLAAMKWMHGFCEEWTTKRVEDAAALIAADAESAHEDHADKPVAAAK